MRVSDTDSVLTALHPEESAVVLALLASEHSELAEEVAELARVLLDEVDYLEAAEQVEDLIRGIDQDVLYDGSGRTARGYVDPADVTWENLSEQIEPFLDDIRRRASIGLEDAALEFCKGVVVGLYRVEYGPFCDARDHVPDWTPETACEAVRVKVVVG